MLVEPQTLEQAANVLGISTAKETDPGAGFSQEKGWWMPPRLLGIHKTLRQSMASSVLT